MTPRTWRSRALVVACAFALGGLAAGATGCGDDGGGKKPPKEKKAVAPKVKPGTPSADVAAAAGKKGGAKSKGVPATLNTYLKAEDKYRKSLDSRSFAPDPTGDVNRDPFRSYLVEEQAPVQGGNKPKTDECEKRMVADQYGMRDLRLVGIVRRGTTAYALFINPKGFGHIARRGDCLSKDKVRLKEIGSNSITVEIRGDAPPGAPAPEPREEEWKLHPESLDFGSQDLSGEVN